MDEKPNIRVPTDVLEHLLAKAKAGELSHVIVVYEQKVGGTGVDASNMDLMKANHLWRVLDGRIRKLYAQAEARASAPRSPTAGVSPNRPGAAAALPRKVRRAVAAATRRAAKKKAVAASPAKPPNGATPPATT